MTHRVLYPLIIVAMALVFFASDGVAAILAAIVGWVALVVLVVTELRRRPVATGAEDPPT